MKIEKEYRTIITCNLLSFIFYIVFGVFLLNLLLYFTGESIQLIVFGTYCRLGDSSFDVSKSYLSVLYSFYFIKIILIGIILYYFLRSKQFRGLKLHIIIIILNFMVFDFLSYISFINDKIFDTYSFKYFFSGASIYLLEDQISLSNHQLSGINVLVGFIISVIILVKTKLFSFMNIVFYYIILIIGAITTILSLEIIKRIL